MDRKELTKRTLFKKQKGVIAVEWAITSPFTMIMTFFTVMFCIFCLNFWAVGNTAFEIAQMLNMGDTGYTATAAMNGPGAWNDSQWSGWDATANTPTYNDRPWFVANNRGNQNTTVTTTANGTFSSSARWAVNQVRTRGGFRLPFMTVRNVDCRVYSSYPGGERTGFSTAKGQTESGDMVVVRINYDYLGWLNFTVRGYSFIV